MLRAKRTVSPAEPSARRTPAPEDDPDGVSLVFPAISGLIVATIAVVVLVFGWAGGSPLFQRIDDSFAAMVPSTALCFLLLGAGLATTRGGDTALAPGRLVASALSALIVIAQLMLLNAGSTLDSMVMTLPRPDDAMAFATALLILLAAYALATLDRPGIAPGNAFAIASTAGLLLAMVVVVAYTFDVSALYEVFVFTAMALHTAITFVVLFFAGLLLARPQLGWAGILLNDGPGSAGARRLFPLVVIGPFLLCLVVQVATQRGLLSESFRLSLLVIALMALAGTAILRNAAIENRARQRLLDTMDELRLANADKELLLREVYHRVKNNLQQVNALLRIEARKIDDPALTTLFATMANRIQAMGLVHQLLVQAPRPSQIDVSIFLENLCRNIRAGHTRRGLALTLQAASDEVHIDVAVSLGLLVNELVANSIKHAFPGGRTGSIGVSYVRRPDGPIELIVADDGLGAPEDYLAGADGGTGTLIIRSLVAQLDGKITTEIVGGTRITVTMPGDISERGRYE